MMLRAIALAVCAALLAPAAMLFPAPTEAASRPLVPADIFAMEEILSAEISPDGRWLAYVRRRPLAQSRHFKHDFMMGNDIGDVWLASMVSNGAPVRITDGARDGSGFSDPLWSPDGRYLALVSTRGGNVRPWMWSRATNRVTRLTDAALDYVPQWKGMAWLSQRVLVCIELPMGAKPRAFEEETRAAEAAMRAWPKSWAGRETTANVLQSGAPIDVRTRPQGALVRIDVESGRTTTIAHGQFDDVSVAPSGAYVAVHQRVRAVPLPVDRPIVGASLTAGYTVIVADDRGRIVWSGADTLTTARSAQLIWSPDGQGLAFSARPLLSASVPHAYVWHEVTRRVEDVTSTDFDIVASRPEGRSGDFTSALTLAWSATNQLAVSGVRTGPGATPRADWWLIEKPAGYRNLTSAMKSVPQQLVRGEDAAFLSVSDGAVWRIAADAPARPITPSSQTVVSIAAPSAGHTAAGTILVTLRDRAAPLARVDLAAGSVTPLVGQLPDNALVASAQRTGAVVLRAIEPDGTYLSVAPVNGAPRPVVEINRFLRAVANAEVRKIEYTSTDGKPLLAWLMLPIRYREGTRYPMVAWVYGGSVVGDRPSTFTNINAPMYLNLQLLAARGYAVIIPSIPLTPEPYLNGGAGSDPYPEMPGGVLPALDRAIALGVADPERLAILGQSYGGYATFALIGQTTRFKAAIALAGLTDLSSLYGTFDPRVRYQGADSDFDVSMEYLIESGQVRMGAPPWKAPERYRQNSPIAYVEKVQTPVMIVQGDMDYVPIQQGEEYFSALQRLGRRAEFVRYWGEGHVLRSQANIEDFWSRVYRWLDAYLAPAGR